MSRTVIFIAALVLGTWSASDRVAAQCVPSRTSGPDIIDCSGTISSTFSAGNGNNIISFIPETVVVMASGQVRGGNDVDTFNVLAGSTVDNAGRIRALNGADIFNIAGTLIRPFVHAGVTWYGDDDLALTASFAGTPAGVGPFAIQAQMDEVQADVAAGLELVNAEGSALRLYYDGHIGDTIQVQSVGLKGSTEF